jgi:hypothetical protein
MAGVTRDVRNMRRASRNLRQDLQSARQEVRNMRVEQQILMGKVNEVRMVWRNPFAHFHTMQQGGVYNCAEGLEAYRQCCSNLHAAST